MMTQRRINMKEIGYLFVLCLLTLNLFACNKRKEYNTHTNAKISDENYEKLIANFIANLSANGHDYEKGRNRIMKYL